MGQSVCAEPPNPTCELLNHVGFECRAQGAITYALMTDHLATTLDFGLGGDLDDAHHPLVLVVDGVTVIDEPTNNHRIGKRDDHL
jgi:hypothetical protein